MILISLKMKLYMKKYSKCSRILVYMYIMALLFSIFRPLMKELDSRARKSYQRFYLGERQTIMMIFKR